MNADASQEAVGTGEQYSLAKILGIWAAAALPMGILGWVVYPALTPNRVADPFGAAITRSILMTAGLVWLFVLVMLIVYREEGDLRWQTMRRRLWLNTPRDPKTGEPRRRLWLWLIPIVILALASPQTYGAALRDLWVQVLPFLAPPPGYDAAGALFESPELRAQVVGAWGFYALFLVMLVFNILGEEVRTLVDGYQSANTYQATWDGKDADGRSVATGIYFCTLKAGEFSQITKMVFLK